MTTHMMLPLLLKKTKVALGGQKVTRICNPLGESFRSSANNAGGWNRALHPGMLRGGKDIR